jgi:uncharacterized protein
MTTYNTPGVYIEEINSLPPAVAAVPTAVPVFIGRTKNTVHPTTGESLTSKAIRIGSMVEFISIYGVLNEVFEVTATMAYSVADGTTISLNFTKQPSHNSLTSIKSYMYYHLQMYFANGGGPCYVLSLGDESAGVAATDYDVALTTMENYDEPTLIVCADACLNGGAASTFGKALAHCKKMKNRFSIIDVNSAYAGGVTTIALIESGFRNGIGSNADELMYGAAYYPYLQSRLNYQIDGASISSVKVNINGSNIDGPIDAVTNEALESSAVKDDFNDVYNAIKNYLNNYYVVLPPSGAIAGVYAATDSTRGVWKAPANVSLAMVQKPMVNITTDFNDGLNAPANGKAVNAIRAFTGKGVLVWGGRTLTGNDLNWRFINVRREVIFIEESVKRALESFVFEPNTANTWIKAKAMVENFLTLIWRDGGLAGDKPEDAFEVNIGINSTMTAVDVASGLMILEMVLVPPRPAEVIILRVSQKLQVS